MNFKVSKSQQYNIYIVIVFSIFVFGQTIRESINSLLYPVNILFCIALFFLLLVNKKSLDTKTLGLIFFLIIHSVSISFLNGLSNPLEYVRMISYLYIPLFLLSIDYQKYDKRLLIKICTRTLKLFNNFAISLVLIYFIDFPLNGLITKTLSAVFFSVGAWMPSSFVPFTYRYNSYLGHSIYTADFILVFFVLNTLYYKNTGKELIKSRYLYLISFMGILSTASKAAILIFAFLVAIFNLKGKRRIQVILGMISLVVVSQSFGLFDYLINRIFVDGKISADLSSGRNVAWEMMLLSNDVSIKFFTGTGYDFLGFSTNLIGHYWATVLLEYPFICYLFMFGIVNFFLYFYVLLIKPCITFAKNKKYFEMISIIAITLMFSSNNIILSGPDALILFAMCIQIIKVISYIPGRKGIINE